MSGRYRTVAIQAVGVAVIGTIIYVAFLRSEEPESLSGIQAEDGGETIVESSPPGDSPKNKPNKAGGKNGQPTQDGRSQSAGAGILSGPEETRDPAPDDDFTPPGDQYDDMVTRLMARVGEPSALEEIDSGR